MGASTPRGGRGGSGFSGRSSDAQERGGGGGGGGGGQQAERDILSATMAAKARELEMELATYQAENTQLKQLRKQQEVLLAESVREKEEVRANMKKWDCEK